MTDLITADEACELLGGVARSTLWRWGKSDPLLAPRRFGPQVHRFSREGIAEYLDKLNPTNNENHKNDH